MTTRGSQTGAPLAHELEGLSTRWLANIGLGMLAVVVVAAVAVAFALRTLAPYTPQFTASEVAQRQLMVPGVQANQAYDREMIAEKERSHLSHYRWQDNEHRFARIPIDKAIEMMAKRKLQISWPESNAQSDDVSANPELEEQP